MFGIAGISQILIVSITSFPEMLRETILFSKNSSISLSNATLKETVKENNEHVFSGVKKEFHKHISRSKHNNYMLHFQLISFGLDCTSVGSIPHNITVQRKQVHSLGRR